MNTETEMALEMARAYYAKYGNECGGSLHVVLDDGNVDDDSVRFCCNWAADNQDADGVDLANKLLTITEDMRHELYCALSGIAWYPMESEDEGT